jgi:predicted restriction endonuclease
LSPFGSHRIVRSAVNVSVPGSDADWVAVVDGLVIAARAARAPHRPILLLYLLGRRQRHESPEVSFAALERAITPALQQYSDAKRTEVLLPFWHLQSSGIWEVRNADELPRRKGKDRPTRATLLRESAVGFIKPAWWTSLKEAHYSTIVGERLLCAMWESEEERNSIARLVNFARRSPPPPRVAT